jgi:hypothetical protein
MFEAKQGKEIVVRDKNRIGVLLDLSKLISQKGIEILAVNGAVLNEDCVIRLVTDDNLRAKEALAGKNYRVHEEDVILLELLHKPGMLRGVAEVLALHDIDIQHVYASALSGQDRCLLVLHTSNDEHVLPRLNKMAALQAV